MNKRDRITENVCLMLMKLTLVLISSKLLLESAWLPVLGWGIMLIAIIGMQSVSRRKPKVAKAPLPTRAKIWLAMFLASTACMFAVQLTKLSWLWFVGAALIVISMLFEAADIARVLRADEDNA